MEIVSRETLDKKLALYVELLLKWQKKINLISEKTADDIWTRHINDSLQIVKLIDDDTQTIIDIGSGAGLPGIPLAAATQVKTILIESDTRKCVFMQEASRVLELDTHIINQRIEVAQLDNVKTPVVITARALASLNDIFKLIHSLLDKNNLHEYKILLPKGRNVSRETEEAENNWEFTRELVQSETNKEASIMIINRLKPR